MNALRTRLRAASENDRGFSLIEVIVAMVILGILTTAALGLYITSIQSAATLQRREIAVTVASQAMESVAATPVAALYGGRSKAAVTAQWASNATASGLSQTVLNWDKSATLPVIVAVPLTRLVSLSGTDFAVTTLIGTCYQRAAGPGAGGDCGVVSSPATSFTALERVMVVVTWTAGDACAGGSCRYETTTLIDSHADQQWKSGA